MAKSVRLTMDQRGRVAEKLMELGNLIFVGLVIAQGLSVSPFRPLAAVVGLALLLIAYLVAFWIMRGGGK